MRNFDTLSEKEILARAITLEEEDERVYADFAEGLRENFPASADVFDGMRVEESTHRRRLLDLFHAKFGDHIPLIRRQDVRGFVTRKPIWLVRPLGLDAVRNQASAMEVETRNFYERAAARAQDVHVRQLLDDLAQEERTHESRADALEKDKLRPDVKHSEDEAERRLFLLQIVQPGFLSMGSRTAPSPRSLPCSPGRLSPPTAVVMHWWSVSPPPSSGHQHGFRRSSVGRRQPHRPRPPLGARIDLRLNDRARRYQRHTLPFLIGDFRLAMERRRL